MCHSRVYFTLSRNQTSLVPIFFSKELIRESLIVRQYSIKEETLGAFHFTPISQFHDIIAFSFSGIHLCR